MNNCIFCKIVNKEIPSKTIYEDDKVLIIMDIEPLSDGHLLLIPKNHYDDLSSTETDVINHMFKVYKDITPKLIKLLDCDGITILQNEGLCQEVKHTHIHIIPTYEYNRAIVLPKDNKVSDIESVFNKLT
ncbi:MAG: HIT family protein [Mycoplasmatales bacterium]